MSNVKPYWAFPAWKHRNEQDKEIVVTKVEDGAWVSVEGHTTKNVTQQATALERAVIFIDTMDDTVKVHVWSDPTKEDPTHVITLKREDKE